MKRTLLVTAMVVAVVGASAQPAAAARSYCSPTGDLCYGASKTEPVRLNLSLAAKYFNRYRLCVTAPSGERECKRFRVREMEQGSHGSSIRWSRHFTVRGAGRYKARWFAMGRALGPGISFRVAEEGR